MLETQPRTSSYSSCSCIFSHSLIEIWNFKYSKTTSTGTLFIYAWFVQVLLHVAYFVSHWEFALFSWPSQSLCNCQTSSIVCFNRMCDLTYLWRISFILSLAKKLLSFLISLKAPCKEKTPTAYNKKGPLWRYNWPFVPFSLYTQVSAFLQMIWLLTFCLQTWELVWRIRQKPTRYLNIHNIKFWLIKLDRLRLLFKELQQAPWSSCYGRHLSACRTQQFLKEYILNRGIIVIVIMSTLACISKGILLSSTLCITH